MDFFFLVKAGLFQGFQVKFHQGIKCKVCVYFQNHSIFEKGYTVEACILEQIDYLWGLAVAKPMI